MPQLTFPLQLGELKLAVVIGLYHQAMAILLLAGYPVARITSLLASGPDKRR
jgi:hypothetical protein